MKGGQHWACTGLTELSLGINKHHLKETGWQKMREGRAPLEMDTTVVGDNDEQESSLRGRSEGELNAAVINKSTLNMPQDDTAQPPLKLRQQQISKL